jgi:hypothetical protein
MKRTDIVDTVSARDAITILVADLRKYANFEFGQTASVLGSTAKQEARRKALLFAADFIEKAL